MKILALDISTHCGWASFDTTKDDQGLKGQLVGYGTVHLGKSVIDCAETYPENYFKGVNEMADKIIQLVANVAPDVIVIEQINKSRNRYSQQILDWIHFAFLYKLCEAYPAYLILNNIKYIDSSQWRKVLGIGLTKEDKKLNSKLSGAKSAAKKSGHKLDKKSLGIRGKINKKHVAIRWVNENFGSQFIVKDNDLCDAICLGSSYINGAKICDGK